MHRHVAQGKKPADWTPRLKVWLEARDRYAFGFGLAEILQAVDKAGSIKQAAAELGKSYRYIWGRIKKAELTIGFQLVHTQVGGKEQNRSFLTPPARDLVNHFLTMRQRMMDVLDQEFAAAFGGHSRQRLNKPATGSSEEVESR